MNAHIGENAELYALGVLDERTRALVDAHASNCEACAARLGEAERTIALIEEDAGVPASLDRRMRTAFERPRRGRFPGGVAAAAFVLGALPSLWFWNGAHEARAFNDGHAAALQAMVSSHFAHAQFTPLVSEAPSAKLIYARTGRWIFVVARTDRALTLRAFSGGAVATLGTLRTAQGAGELFLPQGRVARQFSLFDGSREVERITIPAR